MSALRAGAVGLSFVVLAFAAGEAAGQTAPAAALDVAISRLGDFDYGVRMEAARTVRRAKPEEAGPALEAAVRGHRDEYVRFRAMVILSGMAEARMGPISRAMIGERNDRLRTVAYQWFEHHPDREILPTLVAALPKETSEFVRPALTRAIAAHDDPRAGAALTPLVMRGDDLFRGALIEALGDYRATYAVAPLIDVARLDGPLQDDAITALGKIGDVRARVPLSQIQPKVDPEIQPTLSAAFCLLGTGCDAAEDYLKKTLAFAAASNDAPLLRGVAHALGVLASQERPWALTALFDAGAAASGDAVRAPVALALGAVSLRQPNLVIDAVAGRKDLAAAVDLLQDAFDMLSEDFEEEQFCGAVLRAYWDAAPGSARRDATQRLIDKLEF